MKNLTKLIAFFSTLLIANFAKAQMAGFSAGTPVDQVRFKTCGGLSTGEYVDVYNYILEGASMTEKTQKKLQDCIEKKKSNRGRNFAVSHQAATLSLNRWPHQAIGSVRLPEHAQDDVNSTLVQLRISGGARLNISYIINQDLSFEGYLVRINRKGQVVNYAYIFGDATQLRD